jgi:NCS1 family nucleobase:cation symporter-1
MDALTQERMPTREGDLTIEGHGIEPIPASARYGSPGRVFTVWFTPNLVPAAFFIGTLVAADFLKIGFTTGLIAIVVGNLIGSILVGALATMGPTTGMAQMPVARLPFGKSIVLPGLLNWASCIGWDGVNSVFGAAALSALTGLNFLVGLVIIVIAQGILGIFGYEAIHQFEKWGAIALGIMFAILTVSIAGSAGTGMARVDEFTGLDQLGAFVTYTAIVASFVLAWGLYASDYTRYLPADSSRGRIFWFTVLGLTLSAGWIEILGLAVADKATGTNVETIRDILGGVLGALALVAIAVGTVAVNAMNDYTGSLSLQAAGIRVRRVYSAIVVAVLGFIATLIIYNGDLFHNVESFLLLILYWVTPWAAIVLVDWWLLRGRKADVGRLIPFSALPSGWVALLALIVGFLVSVPFQQSELGFDLAKQTGLPINTLASDYLHFADVAFIVGFLVSGGIYWIGARNRIHGETASMAPTPA